MLGPNGAGKTTTAGMLTTRVIPTSGRAYVGSVDVVAHPALAKQMIGVVSQQNTLDRQLTVWENLVLPRTAVRYGRRGVPPEADRLLEQFHLSQVGQGVGVRAVRRHGTAPDGRARDLPPARRAVPRRADRGARPAEPARALGDPRRAQPRRADDHARDPLHGGGRPALQPSRDHRPRQGPRARHARRRSSRRSAPTRSSPSRPPATASSWRRRSAGRSRASPARA